MKRLVLINTNEVKPPVAPIAIDYLAGALADSGYEADVVDLCFAEDAFHALKSYFAANSVLAVGLSFRNSDDCFWPSGASFVPHLVELVRTIRGLTDAPVVLGGCGFSLFPSETLEACGCQYGIAGDGERAFVRFVRAIERGRGFGNVPGLVRRIEERGGVRFASNPPARPEALRLSPSRCAVDNARYFREGGQGNVETKRGCDRRCIYCADPVIKGARVRTRPAGEVADEVENLLAQGVEVLHLCDSEFNIPVDHARAVCGELTRRGLGSRVRWYTYASVVPFSAELARAMREAGCVGINFGTDSANAQMLAEYGRMHRKEDIAEAVRLCRRHGLRAMIDLLLGGPGETEATVRDTIEFMKEISPYCVGAALGVRVYPGTRFGRRVAQEGPLSANRNLRWTVSSESWFEGRAGRDSGEGLLWPVFYISEALGENPAELVRDIIGGDERFFEPMDEQGLQNYNYNANLPLMEAIRDGARGAYWDILRRMRIGSA